MQESIPGKHLKKHFKKLYHGGKDENLENILQNNFDIKRIGDNMGLTYGEGVYFTDNKNIARVYSNTDTVLEVNVYINSYKLNRKYKANLRKDQKELTELREKVTVQGYNSFESPPSGGKVDDVEIILFKEFLNDIVSMKLVNVKLKQPKPTHKTAKTEFKSKKLGGKFSTLMVEDISDSDSEDISDSDSEDISDSDSEDISDIKNITGSFWNGKGFEKLSFEIKELIACGMQGCVFRVENDKNQSFAMKIEFSFNYIEAIKHFQIIYSINEFKIFPTLFSMSFVGSHDLQVQFIKLMNNEYLEQMFDQTTDVTFVVYIMEMVESVGKYELIRKNRELQSKLCMKIRVLNKLGISHNDYNPGNMLVDTYYNVYLIDFGKVSFKNEELGLKLIRDELNVIPQQIYTTCNKFRNADCVLCNESENNKICCPYCRYIKTEVFERCFKNVDECFEHERNDIELSFDLDYELIFKDVFISE